MSRAQMRPRDGWKIKKSILRCGGALPQARYRGFVMLFIIIAAVPVLFSGCAQTNLKRCGGRVPMDHTCCNGLLVPSYRCCGGQTLESANYICCGGDRIADITEQICCGGAVYSRKTTECCEQDPYPRGSTCSR